MKNYLNEFPEIINNIRQGIERECLRTTDEGHSSLASHHEKLGSKLTHSSITTDYSENLLEYITGVHLNTDDLLKELDKLHAFTLKNIEGELLWPSSIPSLLPKEELIPVADYGKSNTGNLKKLYRVGLGHRYGRSMQSIAGIHYNFSLTDSFWKKMMKDEGVESSLQDYKSKKYFHLIRNFQRNKWLLMYLYGASPVVDKNFLEGKEHDLEKLNDTTYFSKYGTSLRMGGLGYTSSAQESINICFAKVETYIKTLEEARLKSFPEYEDIGLKDSDGNFKQLNTNLLQIDNEFYSNIRPKNIAGRKESALKALHLRGVEYIEVRLLDVNPFEKLGISKDQIHFLHLFLLWCLFEDSEVISQTECHELNVNFQRVITEGRKEGVMLLRDGNEVPLKSALNEIFSRIEEFSESIRKSQPDYQKSFELEKRKVEDISLLPSSKVLNISKENGFVGSHLDLAKDYSSQYKISNECNEKLILESKKSWVKQKEIEDSDTLDFETYLKSYFEDIKI